MALPDYVRSAAAIASAIVWGHSGGTTSIAAVTNNIALNNLATTVARCGVYADLGADWDIEYAVQMMIETGTAPTAGTTIDLYLAWAFASATYWPGRATGTDAAYPSSGTLATALPNLGIPVLSVRAEATGNLLIPSEVKIVRPRGRYVCPVVVNNMNQSIRNQTTPADNLSRIVLTPLRNIISDT